MTLDHTRLGHCSLGFNNSLFVVAGFVNGYGSRSVMKFDLGPYSPREWVSLADLEVPRYYPACSVGQFQGQNGIFVSGGEHMNDIGAVTMENSVEFYNSEENRWVTVHHMLSPRHYHTMTEINGLTMAAGGLAGWGSNSVLPSVEILNGTSWTQANLTVARAGHSSVAIEGNAMFCKP